MFLSRTKLMADGCEFVHSQRGTSLRTEGGIIHGFLEEGRYNPSITELRVHNRPPSQTKGSSRSEILDFICRDITEHKRVEKEIRGLSFAIEHSIDGIATCSPEGRLTYVNKVFAEMHGYAPDKMIEMHVVNLRKEQERTENDPIEESQRISEILEKR
jgi:PAS domain-containing protein